MHCVEICFMPRGNPTQSEVTNENVVAHLQSLTDAARVISSPMTPKIQLVTLNNTEQLSTSDKRIFDNVFRTLGFSRHDEGDVVGKEGDVVGDEDDVVGDDDDVAGDDDDESSVSSDHHDDELFVGFDSFLQVPNSTLSVEDRLHSTSYYVTWPYSSLAWSYYPSSETTIAVYRSESFSAETERDILLSHLRKHAAVVIHPMILAIAAYRAIAASIIISFQDYKKNINSAQERTKYTHPNYGLSLVAPTESEVARRNAANAEWQGRDWGELSAEIMQTAASMATEQLSWHSLKGLALFVGKENETSTGTHSAAPEETISLNAATLYVQKESERLLRNSEKNIQEADALQLKASILLQGLFNLVAQRDQNTNIKIARETKRLSELAKQDSARSIQIAADSRTLARESKRDSTSMKAIAAVTMFFLPGTFVAVRSSSFKSDAEPDTILVNLLHANILVER